MNQISKIIILNCWKRKKEGQVMKKIIEEMVKGKDIEVEISYDDGSLGVWKNYQKALMIPSKEERFRLIIQDDLIVGRQTIDKILYILEKMPEDCFVGFYCPDNKGYNKAKENNHHILKTHTNFWVQAFCVATNHKQPFLDWCKENVKADYKWEDYRLSLYCKNNKVPVYAVLPSLFQHLGAFRSTLGMAGIIGKYKRYSNQFDPTFNVEEINWELELENAYRDETPLDMAEIHLNTIKND
tara:strand:- start:925 stop:1647 length:723 start_codon:yes stop_codon:yes gene_type:complete